MSISGPVIVIGVIVLAFLIALAPLAIWVHAGNAARSLKRQEAMLKEIVDRLRMESELRSKIGHREVAR